MSEGWEVFGTQHITTAVHILTVLEFLYSDSVLNSPKIMGVPLLLLANKQDLSDSLSVEAIRENYEEWWQLRNSEEAHRAGSQRVERRMASLDVMGVSAVEGCV